MVLVTDPPEGGSETEDAKPEVLLVETSTPAGAVTVKSPDKRVPETEIVVGSEANPGAVNNPVAVPVATTPGVPPTPVTEILSTAIPADVPLSEDEFPRQMAQRTCTTG